MAELRLDKFIAENGGITRKDAKNAIRSGRVTINAVTEKNADRKISDQDDVALDGKSLTSIGMVYLMMHKPAGVVSATEDNHDKTVLDVLLEQEDIAEIVRKTELFPVGRLDKDTEGLLLVTNDGELAHRLLSPKRHVDKVYYAKLQGIVPEDAAERFEAGIPVGKEYVAKPAKLRLVSTKDATSEVLITLQEGKFHQVKRMCHEIGCEVMYLKRISMGSLVLDEELLVGRSRHLTTEEITKLKGEQ